MDRKIYIVYQDGVQVLEGDKVKDLQALMVYSAWLGLYSWSHALETALVILLDYFGEEPDKYSLLLRQGRAFSYVAELATKLYYLLEETVELRLEADKIARIINLVKEAGYVLEK